MEKKVSVVVPIYNVSGYLDNCVESIANQSYGNLEIILVDDGSKDDSGKKCDIWKKRDDRIKVIHKENGGLASARNAGYEVSTGKYIMYIDSDDMLKAEIVEKCVKKIERECSDLIIYGYDKISEDRQVLETCVWEEKNYTKEQMFEHLYQAIVEMSFGYAWNKMYRKAVIDKSGVLADVKVIDREDLVYNMELLRYINKVSYLHYVGYEYLQRSTSLLHNSNLARLKGIEYFVNKMRDIEIENKNIKKKVFNMNVLHYLSDCIIKNILWNKELSISQKRQISKELIEKCPYKEELFDDKDNGRHLRTLYKSIQKKRIRYFYVYVKISDWKRKIQNG